MGADQRVAIVTGGAQGIGKGITKRLLGEGIRVVAADIDERVRGQILNLENAISMPLVKVLYKHNGETTKDSVQRGIVSRHLSWKREEAHLHR